MCDHDVVVLYRTCDRVSQ